jgi:multiple sugar transport system substrate-binding protein
MTPGLKRSGLSRRGFLRAAGGTALAVGASGALTACGGGDDSGGGSSTKELSFVYMGTAEQQATWNKLFAKFSEQHPEIKLKAEGIPLSNWGDFFNKLTGTDIYTAVLNHGVRTVDDLTEYLASGPL